MKSIPDQVVAEALKRGVANVIACVEKNNEEANEEKKEAVQRAIKQKDDNWTIYDLNPKTKEFQYSSKPLLQNNMDTGAEGVIVKSLLLCKNYHQ